MAKTIEARVKEIVRENLGLEDEQDVPMDIPIVTDYSRFGNDLGADSLTHMEIIMDIGWEYDLDIPDEDAEKIHTVRDLVSYLEQHK